MIARHDIGAPTPLKVRIFNVSGQSFSVGFYDLVLWWSRSWRLCICGHSWGQAFRLRGLAFNKYTCSWSLKQRLQRCDKVYGLFPMHTTLVSMARMRMVHQHLCKPQCVRRGTNAVLQPDTSLQKVVGIAQSWKGVTGQCLVRKLLWTSNGLTLNSQDIQIRG